MRKIVMFAVVCAVALSMPVHGADKKIDELLRTSHERLIEQKYEESETAAKEALKRAQTTEAKKQGLDIICNTQLANIYTAQKRYDDANALYDSMLADVQKELKKQPQNYFMQRAYYDILLSKAEIMMRQGETQKAVESCAAVEKELKALPGNSMSDQIKMMCLPKLMSLYFGLGQDEKGQAVQKKLSELSQMNQPKQ